MRDRSADVRPPRPGRRSPYDLRSEAERGRSLHGYSDKGALGAIASRAGAGAAILAVSLAIGQPAAARAGADPVLAAAGDIACAPGSTVDAQDCQQAGTAALIEDNPPSAVATLGDEQYDSGLYSEFTGAGAFNDTWGAFKPKIYPSPGNHEYNASSTAAGYFQYFGASGHGPNGYYSYDLGDWHLISLNSNCTDASGCANHDSGDGAATSAEVTWLQNDLNANPGKCTLAYWHHPLFSSAATPGSPGVKPLWDALYAHGADLVLNGHAHDYERFAPQDPTGVATSAGLTEIISGTGGEDHDGFGTTAANSVVRDGSDFGALFLTLHPGGYDWQFKTLSGTAPDSGSATCHETPLASTGSATPTGPHDATISGAVNPEGSATTYHFDYGTSTEYGSRLPSPASAVSPTDSSSHTLSLSLSGLQDNTTYHYRLVATNAAGVTIDGQDGHFTTPADPPATATTGGTADVAQTSATVQGTIGEAAGYHFDYGTSQTYASHTTTQSGTSGPVHASLAALTPGTTYHYRLVATNPDGVDTDGTDSTFRTPDPPATATTGGTADVAQTSATVQGTIGEAAGYHFDYGTSQTYTSHTATQSGTSGPVSAALAALTPGTTYHYRLVATNPDGVDTDGADGTFRTPDPPATATTGTDAPSAPAKPPPAPAEASLSVAGTVPRQSLERRGLTLNVRCPGRCTLHAALVTFTAGRRRGHALARRTEAVDGVGAVTLRLARAERRWLERHPRIRALLLETTVTRPGPPIVAARKIALGSGRLAIF